MRAATYFILLITTVTASYLNAHCRDIKQPEFSQAFYPADKNELSALIDIAIKEANPPKVNGEVIGLLVPHAGYEFSGKVAAFAYKTVQNSKFDTVVIIASAHQHYINGAALYPGDSFMTPFGILEVDREAMKPLEDLGFCAPNKEYFSNEHPIEVQLPFIAKTLNSKKILPIITGKLSLEDLKKLAGALNELSLKKRILVIASSDLSHFHTYEEATAMDAETIKLIADKDINYLWTSEEYAQNLACGIYPIITLIYYSNLKNAQIDILKYANSGDVSADKSKVVGYAAAASYVADKMDEPVNKEEPLMTEFKLNDAEKKELLKIARLTLESYLKTGKIPKFKAEYPALNEKRGAFVTLKNHGELRGCIGRIVADTSLYEVISNVAVESATQDWRFSNVTCNEMKDIEIEISVLTPFEKVNNIEEIEVGKHGLVIVKGSYSGLLLPQVPLENGWDREAFLKHTCRKAGLPPDSYKDKEAALYKFSAIVFNDKQFSK